MSVATGRDLALKGARIEADSADLDIGRNLTIESRLDTAEGSNQSSGYSAGVSVGIGLGADGAGPTFGASASVNGAKGSNSSAWVNAPSGIVTDNALNADVGQTTSITGGVIASRSGDLTLETERLETADIDLHRKGRQVSGSVGVSIGSNPEGKSKPGITVEGAYSNSETEGVARAAIGEGEIIVRDGDGDGIKAADLEAEADAAETEGDTARAEALRTEAELEAAEDKTTTETQLANINRDPDAVVEVTSQKQEGFELYVSDTAVRAVQKSLKEATAPGGFIDKYLLGRNLTEDEKANIKDAVTAVGAGGHLAGCTLKEGGVNPFNPLNWWISSAFAAGSECGIILPDGSFKRISVDTYDKCKDAIYAYLNSLALSERHALLESAGVAVGEQNDPMLGGELNAWLRLAVAKLNQEDPLGGDLLAFQNGYDLGLEERKILAAKLEAIRTDPKLSIQEKNEAFRQNGFDIVTEVAMAVFLGRAGQNKGRATNTVGGGRFRPSQPLDSSGNPIIRTNDRGSVQVQPNRSVTCGQHSCGMVLNTQGNPVAVDDLIRTHPVTSSAGTTVPDLQRLLRDNGVSSVVRTRRSVSDLESMTAGGRPSIAMVRTGPNTNHYVVVDGVTTRSGQRVVAVRDPAGGPNGGVYYETVSSFEGRFTGNAIQIRD